MCEADHKRELEDDRNKRKILDPESEERSDGSLTLREKSIGEMDLFLSLSNYVTRTILCACGWMEGNGNRF